MTPLSRRPQFPPHSDLRQELTARVDDYFAREGIDPRGGGRMLAKTAWLGLWIVGSYLLLLLVANSWWTAVPLAISLGLGLAGAGFCVMHDGGHGAYSRKKWVNSLMARTLDLMGGSSYFWNQKHNVVHHSFTNVDGIDDDIDSRPFVRMGPTQPRYWFHRWQHWYVLPLVGLFFIPKWGFIDDFVSWIRGKLGSHAIPRPGFSDGLVLLLGKASLVTWSLVIPLLLHPVLPVLVCYLVMAATWGITLALVFQLAHAVEGTAFEALPPPGQRLQRSFFEHQLATTANFSPRSRVLTWYTGGLNYQVEHHLFPKICHLHYPAIAPIVREVCRERGLPYHSNDTLWQALQAHLRFMVRMGRPDDPALATTPAPASLPLRAAA